MKDVGGVVHVGLTVSDLDRSVKFYSENFGLEKIAELCFTAYVDGFFGEAEDARELYKVAPGTTCPLVMMQRPDGGVVLELFRFTPQQEPQLIPWDRPGITHFAFETEHFDDLYKRLKANGVEFCMRPGVRLADGLNWVFLRDPDGNMIEVLGP